MDGPVDLRIQAYTPARIFSLEEANALLPSVSEIFRRMDPKLVRLRELQDLIEDSEAYWGSKGETMPPNERVAYARLLDELHDARASLDTDMNELAILGCEVKDVNSGLVDFPGIVEGHLSYLCWQRGETSIANWHTLEGGFAGRRPLKA